MEYKIPKEKPLTVAQKAALAHVPLRWRNGSDIPAHKKTLNNLLRIGAIQSRPPTEDEAAQGVKDVFYRKTQLDLFERQE